MDPNFWKINGTPMAELGVVVASADFRSSEASVVTLRIVEEDFTAAGPLAWNASVVITRDGVDWFRGVVDRLPAQATGSSEGKTIDVVDIWERLERLVYQQTWRVGDGTGSTATPRAVLGMSAAGAPLTTLAQVQEILSFAAANGVPVTVGSFSAGVSVRPTMVESMSCAECIRQLLRWHPHASATAVYTGGTTTISVQDKAELPTVTRSAVTTPTEIVESVSVDPLYKMQVSAVALKYEVADQVDGVITRSIVPDIFPVGASGFEDRAVCDVIPLKGVNSTSQKQRIEARFIPQNLEALNIVSWYLDHLPFGDLYPAAKFEVLAHERALIELKDPADVVAPINPNAQPLKAPEDTADDYPRELLEGAIEDWMRVKARGMKVRGLIRYKLDPGEVIPDDLKNYFKADGNLDTTIQLTATDAQSKLYKSIASWEGPEAVPTGVAQQLFNLWSVLPYAGAITTVAAEVGDVSGMIGRALSLSGGSAAWSTMDAVITGIGVDIDAGRMQISYGPARRLSSSDYIEMLKAQRANPISNISGAERDSEEFGSEGSASSNGESVGGFNHPVLEVDIRPGDAEVCSGPTIEIGSVSGALAIGLSPGQLTSGTYNVEVNTGGPWTIAGTQTEYIWLEVNGDAVETDGVLTGGFNGTSYLVTSGASLPAPTIPDHGSPTGKAIIQLGRVDSVDGVMSINNRRCGHINLTFCPGQGFGW